MQVRQSDIASWSRCPQQAFLSRQLREDGERQQVLSATAFGTVIHHAVQILETLHHEGRQDACERAVDTFEHYWHPDNIDVLVPGGVDTWLPRQTYGGLRDRGRNNLRAYQEWLNKDTGKLLALELPFELPIVIDGVKHSARGTVDRLALRTTMSRPYLSVEDFKSGAKPNYLRHAFQWTYYSWASTQRAFWDGWPPEDLQALVDPLANKGLALYDDGTGRPLIPRRGRWIALRETFGVHDCGWRNPVDFARMKVALREYIASNEAGIYPLNIKGDTCTFCPFAYSGHCGGVAIDTSGDGDPYSPNHL